MGECGHAPVHILSVIKRNQTNVHEAQRKQGDQSDKREPAASMLQGKKQVEY